MWVNRGESGLSGPLAAHPYTPQMRKRHLLIEIAQTVALTVVAFYLLQTFIAQPFRVEQGSMRMTFEPGEYVLVDKLSARLRADPSKRCRWSRRDSLLSN